MYKESLELHELSRNLWRRGYIIERILFFSWWPLYKLVTRFNDQLDNIWMRRRWMRWREKNAGSEGNTRTWTWPDWPFFVHFFFQTESNSREREKSRNEEGEYSIRYQVLDDKAALTEKKNSNGTNLLELFFLVVENREEEPERISR